jgi:hypothetical protein
MIRLARLVADQYDSVNAMTVALDGLAAMGDRLRGANEYIADLYAGRVDFDK